MKYEVFYFLVQTIMINTRQISSHQASSSTTTTNTRQLFGALGVLPLQAPILVLMFLFMFMFMFAAPLTGVALASSKTGGSSLAMVINQRVVTYKDVYDMGLADARDRTPVLSDNAELRQAVVESEILSMAISQIRVPEPTQEQKDAYVQAILDSQGATRQQLLDDLEAGGMTYESYMARVTLDLKRQSILQNVITPTVVISSRDILEYGFGEYTEAKPYVINIVYDPKLDTQITELFRDGLRAQELAALSQVVQAVVIPYSNVGDIRDELQPLVKTLKKGVVSPVKVVDGNAYRFYITEDPSVIASFYDLDGRVLQGLYAERVQKTYAQWLEMQIRFSIVQVFN